MEITKAVIDHTARLSRLPLDEEENARMRSELEQILSYMRLLDSVEPLEFAIKATAPMREDEAAPSMPREALFENAPVHNEETFLVPKAVET